MKLAGIIGPKESPTELAGEFADAVRRLEAAGRKPCFIIALTYQTADGERFDLDRWYCGLTSLERIGLVELLMGKTVGLAYGDDEEPVSRRPGT